MKSWVISYNPYTDVFQFYDSRVIDKRLKLNNKVLNGWKVAYYHEDPVFVEVANTYEQIGDIETMPKEDIIKKVKNVVK